MAAHPIGIVVDGKIELPDEAKTDPRFREGARLELVPITPASEEAPTPRLTEEPWEEWRKLAGSWAHVDVDPNALLDEERKRELEDEARWRD